MLILYCSCNIYFCLLSILLYFFSLDFKILLLLVWFKDNKIKLKRDERVWNLHLRKIKTNFPLVWGRYSLAENVILIEQA